MDFEDLQKAWQSQKTSAQVTINAEMLLKEVRRNQRQFWVTIFWRDVREVGLAFLLALYFAYHGWKHHAWTDYLSVFACMGVGTFMLVDRVLQLKKRPVSNDSLKGCIEASLVQINHQIWLLKNVFWWYLLPFIVATAISMSYRTWHGGHFSYRAVMDLLISVLFVALVFWGIYQLNQFAVRKNLEVRRKELEVLSASLGDVQSPPSR